MSKRTTQQRRIVIDAVTSERATPRPQSKPGSKDDAQQARFAHLPWHAVDTIVAVLTYGARRYGPENWRKVEHAGDRYWAACQRHLSAYRGGEWIDKESGLPHLAHAACSIVFLLTFGEE